MPATVITCNRIKNGKASQEDICVEFHSAEQLSEEREGDFLPEITIRTQWRKTLNRWATEDTYTCREFSTTMGRAFTLHKLGDEPETYNCLIANPQDCICDCKGFLRFGHCKHLDALRHLLETGELDGLPESLCTIVTDKAMPTENPFGEEMTSQEQESAPVSAPKLTEDERVELLILKEVYSDTLANITEKRVKKQTDLTAASQELAEQLEGVVATRRRIQTIHARLELLAQYRDTTTEGLRDIDRKLGVVSSPKAEEAQDFSEIFA